MTDLGELLRYSATTNANLWFYGTHPAGASLHFAHRFGQEEYEGMDENCTMIDGVLKDGGNEVIL